LGALELFALQAGGPERLKTPPGVAGLHHLDVPDGIYEGLRTFGHARFLFLDRHVARARRSMSALGWSEPLDEELVRRGLDAATRAFPPELDAAVRLDVFEHELDVLGATTRHLLALAEHVPVPRAVLERGVTVGVARGMARHTPPIKRNEWIARRRGTGPGDGGFFEHLLVDERERILEGSSCNVFCAKDSVLLTAGAGVLAGIQRGVFCEIASRAGIDVREEAVPLDAVGALDEMFLTSSSRAAVPIVAVEGRRVGPGVPGPIWRMLLARYEELAADARPAVPGGEPADQPA
jgi:branched-subunit amino acid aminotransferase/4-amino-4-deoxychorismate lyase